MSTLTARLTSTPAGMKLWQQERCIFETTERLCELMELHKVSRSELAKRLGTTKGYVTQLLDGSANMTLRTLSDVYLALGYEFHPADSPIGVRCESQPFIVRRPDLWTKDWRPQVVFSEAS
ncbi:MAG: helix-turn-helix domain-containing protein [Pirellulales bacterium]|nr:helix-turn-helix domain-containing protein [Pirellulales bacterium]